MAFTATQSFPGVSPTRVKPSTSGLIVVTVTRTRMISALTDNSEMEHQVAQAHPFRRLGEPEEIADAAVFLASSLSNGITGLNMSVDGGLHAQLSV